MWDIWNGEKHLWHMGGGPTPNLVLHWDLPPPFPLVPFLFLISS